MHDDFTRQFTIAVVLLLGLLGLNAAPALMRNNLNRLRLQKLLMEMRNRDLNREDYDALAAGYYEGLRKDAGPWWMPLERDDVCFRDRPLAAPSLSLMCGGSTRRE